MRRRFEMTDAESTLGYEFSLALQTRHPNLSAEVWSKRLRMVPVRSWTAGQPRTTPTGRRLVGTYKASYGCWELAHGHGDSLVRSLAAMTERLSKHTRLVQHWRATGGTVAYYLALSGRRTIPVVLPPELLAKMGELGIELGIEALHRDT
jgi:hypothetical protein